MTDKNPTGPSPIAVSCPACNAAENAVCRYPNGQSMGRKYHAPRVAAVPNAPIVVLPTAAPAVTAEQAEQVRNNSICVVIKLSRFTTRRTVKRGDVDVTATEDSKADVDQDMVTVAKDLLDSEELRAIVTFDHYTKLYFKSRSVPSPLIRSGAYLFAVDALPEMYAYLEQRAKDRRPLVDAFAAALPGLKAKAKESLGPLFDPSQYPKADAVAGLFTFEWQVVEIGTPDQKLRAISQALFDKEKAKAEATWASAVGQIEQALAEGMAEVVDYLSERMGAGDEPPKRFRASAISKVTEFVSAFGQRNIVGNQQLADLVGKARLLLDGVDAKVIKKDGAARKRVAEGMAAIKGSLDKMESRPSRAAVVIGEEV